LDFGQRRGLAGINTKRHPKITLSRQPAELIGEDQPIINKSDVKIFYVKESGYH
jgi:hypothetical protein